MAAFDIMFRDAHRSVKTSNGYIDSLTFEEWWREFRIDGRPREDPYRADDRLARYIDGLSASKRVAFVDELTDLTCRRGDDWAIAARAVENYAGRSHRARVLEVVERLPAVRPPALLGDYREMLLRILTRDPHGEFLGPVRAYGEQPIGPGYTTVIWGLWPHHRALFAKLHARFLAEEPKDSWADTAVIQALVRWPKALAAVRDVLIEGYPEVWPDVRDAALKASAADWLEAQRADVQQICASVCP